MEEDTTKSVYKYRQVYNDLKSRIYRGEFSGNRRLPSASQIAVEYGISRPTATKVLKMLREDGLTFRARNRGTNVPSAAESAAEAKQFGLLIPGLGSAEIFEPITSQIAARSAQDNFSLLWIGSAIKPEGQLSTLEYAARRYVESRIAGVFFAPIELGTSFVEGNKLVISILSEAKIPVVLIDTDYLPFPERSAYDLVSIDHYRGGFILTQHFLNHGHDRIDFLARPYSAYTISIRILGYRTALFEHGIVPKEEWVHIGDPSDPEFVLKDVLGGGARNIICGNDDTAAVLMGTFAKLSVSVPDDVRIIGFDDVRYAQHLSVPLTTLKQPCKDLGNLAVDTMLARLKIPSLPPMTVMLRGSLVTRKSCGCI